MAAAGKHRNHAARIGCVGGLAEHLAIDDYGGIGAEHHFVGRGLDGERLAFRQTLYIIFGPLARKRRFVHWGGPDCEGNSSLPQNLAAPRRLRGKHQHAFSVE